MRYVSKSQALAHILNVCLTFLFISRANYNQNRLSKNSDINKKKKAQYIFKNIKRLVVRFEPTISDLRAIRSDMED